ncbi:VOC family protein [Pseudoxanthomonas sp. J35]|uniref:VOC family protein n=1 Tax=Pseudoxanthomonas sp. J35 TaxID=935852 RepID=UPI0004BB64EF|nr:VOC family protein [Pseudoxanthomonas sp. J35]
MLAQSRLDTVVLFVSSLARSVAFYRDTLGLAVTRPPKATRAPTPRPPPAR